MDKIEIKINSSRTRQGYRSLRIQLLAHLPEAIAGDWQQALQNIANSYSTCDVIGKFIIVSNVWLACHKNQPTDYPIPPVSEHSAHHMLKNLRRIWYERELIQRKNRFITANLRWGNFMVVLRRLAHAGLFPPLNFDAKVYRPVPNMDFHLIRNQARIGTLADSVMPKGTDLKNDSFHDGLLVSLSLHKNDNDYLVDYEKKLDKALDTYQKCAFSELQESKAHYQAGQKMMAEVDYGALLALIESRKHQKKLKHYDPETGFHFFLPHGGHPNVLANLLAMVGHEMGGLPQSCKIMRDGKQASLGPRRWRYVQGFGKNRLLPYLGILNSRSAVPLIVLLLLEHPRINVESLFNARLEDRHGQVVLFSKAGENNDDIRFSVEKPRAGSQKHVLLSALGQEVLRLALLWTGRVRKELLADGRADEANFLWVGFTDPSSYSIGRLMPDSIRSAFRQAPYLKNFTDKQRQDRQSFNSRGGADFIRSHSELADWASSANLYQLRISRGVLDWFKSGGDLDATARAFGHRNIRTTIENYIPKPLQDALYERQIRRWQNFIISAACAERPYLLGATDYTTLEELHQFLAGLMVGDALQAQPDNGLIYARLHKILNPNLNVDKIDNSANNPDKKVCLVDDPGRMAIAFLYREHLLLRPTAMLDTPDQMTHCTPRMWLDLANALQAGLPDTCHELGNLVAQARQRADEIRSQVKFYEIENYGDPHATSLA